MVEIPEGVYSETKVQKIGTMGTARTQTIVDYYRCTRLDDNTMSIQILDMYGDPIPLVEKVKIEDFLKRFTYEPDKFKTKKSPSDLATEKAVATAEKHMERKEYHSAEFEFSKALKLDEENVRANFGLGKVYMETGEVEKATQLFTKLASEDKVLDPENRHILNQLGIELRGLSLYEQAIQFYEKAYALAKDDENLLFNIGRAYFEKGEGTSARSYLEKALAINPKFEAATRLIASIKD